MGKKMLAIIMTALITIVLLSGCIGESQKGERAKMLDSQPTETLTYSNERKIFEGYLKQVNDPNNIQFIYLFDYQGHVIFRGTVMGKAISATKSTEPYERAIIAQGTVNAEDEGAKNFAGYIPGTPQLMNPSGMFGHDTPGVIWLDPEGKYHEWHNGPYLVTSYPIKIQEPIISFTNIDNEMNQKIEAMRQKLTAGGTLTDEEKMYLNRG